MSDGRKSSANSRAETPQKAGVERVRSFFFFASKQNLASPTFSILRSNCSVYIIKSIDPCFFFLTLSPDRRASMLAFFVPDHFPTFCFPTASYCYYYYPSYICLDVTMLSPANKPNHIVIYTINQCN